MTTTVSTPDLIRYREIVLAAIEYLSSNTASIKFDNLDSSAHQFQLLKQRTDKYYKAGQLEKLQKLLDKLIEKPRLLADLDFVSFIIQKTGHELDLFENIHASFDKIIARKAINSQGEYHDMIAMNNWLKKKPGDQEKIDLLEQLLVDFNRRNPAKYDQHPTFSNLVKEVESQDKKHKLSVIESGFDENDVVTYVFIHFGNSSGGAFAVKGKNLNLQPYWKDNNTVVIEIKTDYQIVEKHIRLESGTDQIRVEYC